MKKLTMILMFSLFAAACGSDTPTDDNKPTVDPDSQFVDDRSDGLSNHWTTIMGQVDPMDQINASIDYPDYFHGYLIELEEGAEMSFSIDTTASSIVRLYGPARNNSTTNPKFGRAKVRANTEYDQVGDRHVSNIEFTARDAGTYMLVLGPKFVWSADYVIKFRLIRDGECFGDSDCGDGEACVDNGVRCVTAPCDVNYDVCMPIGGCQNHNDCGEDAWCRSTDWDSTLKECVPFVGEGENCGGFAPPQYVNACEPDLSCVYRPFVADAPGRCRNAVTVDELKRNPAAYDGVRVSIDGFVMAGIPICTQMACSIDNACCNSCGASMQLIDEQNSFVSDGVSLIGADDREYGCGGNNCNYADNCTTEPGEYRVLGTFSIGQYGQLQVNIEEITSLESL